VPAAGEPAAVCSFEVAAVLEAGRLAPVGGVYAELVRGEAPGRPGGDRLAVARAPVRAG
jgi:hypothetical protein